MLFRSSKDIYFLSVVQGTEQIFKINVESKKIDQITNGDFDYASVSPVNDETLIALRHSISKPDEIYSIKMSTKEVSELSFENKDILDQLTMGKVEGRWIGTTDNKKMLTWIIYPPHFDPNKKYPTDRKSTRLNSSH